MANQFFQCVNVYCGFKRYQDGKLAPSHITVSQTPCPKCGAKMIRKP